MRRCCSISGKFGHSPSNAVALILVYHSKCHTISLDSLQGRSAQSVGHETSPEVHAMAWRTSGESLNAFGGRISSGYEFIR